MIACWHAARACSGCIITVVYYVIFHWGPFELSGDHNTSFSRAYKKAIMNSVVVRSAMSIGQSLLLIIQTLMSPIIFFPHPCVLNQRLGWVRWFHAYWGFCWSWDDSFQWGSAGIPNTGESALLLCRTCATIAYVRNNAVCRMKYAVREYASSLLSRSYCGGTRQRGAMLLRSHAAVI